MSTLYVQCPKCKTTLLDGVFNREDFSPCPGCESPLQVTVYPALFRRAELGRTGEIILSEGEASCFYHPQKKAVLPCEACGRFVCALCDCEHKGQHLCPACLETGRTKGKIKSLENRRVRYDNLAMSVALLSTLIFYFSLLTSPIVLYVAIRYWKSPMGLTQRSRAKLLIAGVLASLQIIGWTLLFIGIFTKATR